MELVIASNNPHKIRELRAIFKTLFPKHLPCDLRSLLDFPQYVAPPETEDTFEGNAKLKAAHAAAALNRWTIADDSGLVVPALGGDPGVYSARYAGAQATDVENRKKLLSQMQHLLDEDRNGYFECWIAVASPAGVKKCTHGICEGTILTEEKGGGGFGYDPLFVKHGYRKTFAEIEETIKTQVSHRGKAMRSLLPFLESLFSTVEV